MLFADLEQQWHPTRNGNLVFSSLTPSSNRKVWWLCKEGHEWETSFNLRARRGYGCPYCSGRLAVPGVNDLATTNPEIAAEWHPDKNTETVLLQTKPHSGKKVWWKCCEGHEWEAVVASRTNGARCPYCAGKKPSPVNNLQTTHPHLAKQWHPTRNKNLTPENVSAGSGKKVWWVCEAGHEWETFVYNRTKGKGCPYCKRRNHLQGITDLATTHPHLVAQWHPTRNPKHTPSQVFSGARHKIWWICEEDHEWEATLYSRTRSAHSTGCPFCNSARNSRLEQEISDFIENFLVVERNRRKLIPPHELDIYIPEKQVAIEFNGLYWHTEEQGKHRTYHYDKWLACQDKGIQLIQIWEDEWNRNPELVKRMLAHKLGVSLERKVYARETVNFSLRTDISHSFLNTNHIQGSATGSYYLGLRDIEKEELVAVMVLKKEPGTAGRTLNIIRYATSVNVVGGFTKLLKHAERTYKPEKFITFSDHCVSDGGLYEKNGFVADKELPPDYMYVVKGERKHKFGYRLKKFRDDPNLLWEEGLTERELAALNGIPRIWDAGKTRWVKPVG